MENNPGSGGLQPGQDDGQSRVFPRGIHVEIGRGSSEIQGNLPPPGSSEEHPATSRRAQSAHQAGSAHPGSPLGNVSARSWVPGSVGGQDGGQSQFPPLLTAEAMYGTRASAQEERLPYRDRQDSGSVSSPQSVFPRWLVWLVTWGENFAVPPASTGMGEGVPRPDEQERAYRGRIVAIVLAVFVVGLLFFVLPDLWQFVLHPSVSDALDAVIAPVLLVIFIGIARLNHSGHVTASGIFIGCGIAFAAFGVNIIGDLAGGGYNWVDTPGWDIAAIGLLVIGVTAKYWHALIALGCYLTVLFSIILIMPQLPSVYTTDVEAEMGAVGLARAQAFGALVFDLSFRAVIVALFLVTFGIFLRYLMLWLLRVLDGIRKDFYQQQVLVFAQEVKLQYQDKLSQWAHKAVIGVTDAWSHGYLYIPPDLTTEIQNDPVMRSIRELLGKIGRRMYPGQQVMRALEAWRVHLSQLPVLLGQLRLDHIHAVDGDGSLNEFSRLVAFDVPAECPEVQAVQLELGTQFKRIAREGDDLSKEIVRVTHEFLAGHRDRRINDEGIPGHFGSVVAAINILFDEFEKHLDG